MYEPLTPLFLVFPLRASMRGVTAFLLPLLLSFVQHNRLFSMSTAFLFRRPLFLAGSGSSALLAKTSRHAHAAAASSSRMASTSAVMPTFSSPLVTVEEVGVRLLVRACAGVGVLALVLQTKKK